jgi:four helix bundle protein
MARGSNLELQTQLLIAKRLRLGDPMKIDRAEVLSGEVSKMLVSLLRKLGNSRQLH